jgi:hypothetical protein
VAILARRSVDMRRGYVIGWLVVAVSLIAIFHFGEGEDVAGSAVKGALAATGATIGGFLVDRLRSKRADQ